jgi:histidine ammonia-lyase
MPLTAHRSPVLLSGATLTHRDVERVARDGAGVAIAPAALEHLARVRAALERAASDGQPHYGINTGFGSFSRERIAPAELRELQRNLIRSHAAGVGAPLDPPTVRATMLVLAASLCRGRSGVRPELISAIAAMLNTGLTPVVPEIGSVGASGDLAPLAHIALALIGEGEVFSGSSRRHAHEALASAGLAPVTLEPKEGLALINGTHLMTARLALLRARFERLFPAALAGAAMSIEACRATDAFLDPRVYEARNQPGPAEAALGLRTLLHGSRIIPSHDTPDDPRVQDPYSIRCAAYVLGAALDAARYAFARLDDELGAVTDNPLVLSAEGDAIDIVSAGNFHGMPVAIPLDVLAISLSHIAGIAERRIDQMLSAHDPETRLRPFLSPKPGLHSGLMIVQYTAAAMCNELAGLAMPASVVNIPTSAGIEDYNSFGPRGAAKASRAMDLCERVVAIELLCAAQGLEAHRPLRSGPGVERAHAIVREKVPPLESDRPPSPDIESIAGLIADGRFTVPITEKD